MNEWQARQNVRVTIARLREVIATLEHLAGRDDLPVSLGVFAGDVCEQLGISRDAISEAAALVAEPASGIEYAEAAE